MDNLSIDDLRGQLAGLEAKAARLSQKIDFGFETTTTREREVSDERNELHEQINSIRELLRERETA